ncbi:hypothetical protein MMC07_004706 [Pseudocyphellaria aurata]|nr:hypothetical protein [Pseudocyphellaria aurata]
MQDLGSVIVIGGCGFLGGNIVSQLLELTTAEVHVFDLRTDLNRLPSVTYHEGDVSSARHVLSVFQHVRPTVVIHTASPSIFSRSLIFFMKINVDGTRNLLECAQKVGVKAFVYTSSASVIHDTVSDLVNVDESAPVLYIPDQKEAYNHTKALAEDLVLAANRKNDSSMLTVALRPSGLFGEGDPTAVKMMVNAAASGKYKYQIGEGKNLTDWTYVGNAAHAHILAAGALLSAHGSTAGPESDRVDGETFLVTNDEPMPFWEFVRGLGAAAGYPTKSEQIQKIPVALALLIAITLEWLVWLTSLGRRQTTRLSLGLRFGCMTRTFCIDKAKRRLGYKPLVNMEDGIKRAGGSFATKTKKMD